MGGFTFRGRRLFSLVVLAMGSAAAISAPSGQAGAATTDQALSIAAVTGVGSDVLGDYAIALKLFKDRPGSWGGAYADGDTLVIKVIGQSLRQAADSLASAGAQGNLRFESSRISMTSLDRQLNNVDQALRGNDRSTAQGWGPDYQKSEVIVEALNADAAMAAIPTVTTETGDTTPPIAFRTSPGRASTSSRYFDTIRYYGGKCDSIIQRCQRADAASNCRNCYSPMSSFYVDYWIRTSGS